MLRFLILCSLGLWMGCDHPEGEEEGSAVRAVLKSSKLAQQSLQLASGVTLTNITGLADSIGFNFTEDLACGFHVWGAGGQTSRSGLEGRLSEAFDLGDPVSWESMGAGLQGECDSATIAQVESYFLYMDLHLTVGGSSKVVRAYMSQQAPFEAGDIVLKSGSVLSWYDKDTDTLVASTATRPSNPATFKLEKEVPWYDNNGADKIIMMEFRINTDVASYQVTKKTGHAVIDVDFTNSGLAVTDATDDASLMRTISLPFLEASQYSSLLTATLTLSEDRPEEEEAMEDDGNAP